MTKTRSFITVEPPEPVPAPRYVVVEYGGDLVVSPQGSGKYEDSSCVDAPCAPVIFDSLPLAEKVADAFYVNTLSFCSFWEVRELPPSCQVEGLALLLLPEFADAAKRMREVYGDEALAEATV